MTPLPRHPDLASWLRWQETLNPSAIDLGLDRVREVWGRIYPGGGRLPFPVITVGGTNGKGSCVAMLEAIYRELSRLVRGRMLRPSIGRRLFSFWAGR